MIERILLVNDDTRRVHEWPRLEHSKGRGCAEDESGRSHARREIQHRRPLSPAFAGERAGEGRVDSKMGFPSSELAYGIRGGFAFCASCKACAGNQAPAAGSTIPQSGSNVLWAAVARFHGLYRV